MRLDSFRLRVWNRVRPLLTELLLSALILLIHGYHYGIEDEGVYLPAVRKLLNPALYPHDTPFFATQTGWTVFPWLMASLRHVSGIPLRWCFFLVYCISIFLFVRGLRMLAARVFTEPRARLAAVLLPCALWTMPVAGTALFLMDQHLHPRNLATIALLFALIGALDGRIGLVCVLVGVATLIHPMMAFYGASLLILFLKRGLRLHVAALALALPLAWHFVPPASDAWRSAANSYLFLSNWAWYEWLGAAAPLAIVAVWAARHRTEGSPGSALARSVVRFGLFYLAVAILICLVPRFAPMALLQPMRVLQLVYLLLLLLLGGLAARSLPSQLPALAAVLAGICLTMAFAQVSEFPGSPHIEWPFRRTENDWLLAFAWISTNTPVQAYFVTDPRYLEEPGEDFHGFRALAQRSVLADDIKDRAVVRVSPSLAREWQTESEAERGWKGFNASSLQVLRQRFGVDWVVIEQVNSARFRDLDCPYRNGHVSVCRIAAPLHEVGTDQEAQGWGYNEPIRFHHR